MVINLSLRVIKSFLINIFTSTMNLFHLQLNLSRLLRLYGLLSVMNIFILIHPNRHILVSFKCLNNTPQQVKDTNLIVFEGVVSHPVLN